VRYRKLILLLILAALAVGAEHALPVVLPAPGDAAVPPAAVPADSAASNTVADSVARIKDDLRRQAALESPRTPRVLPDWQSSSQPTGAGAAGKAFQGLALCLGVFLIAVGIVRRFRRPGAAAAGRSVRIIERLPLSPKTALVVVEFGGERILLSQGSEQITCLQRTTVRAAAAPRELTEQLCRVEKLSA
jgi:flagellar biosynthetic protein FliO